MRSFLSPCTGFVPSSAQVDPTLNFSGKVDLKTSSRQTLRRGHGRSFWRLSVAGARVCPLCIAVDRVLLLWYQPGNSFLRHVCQTCCRASSGQGVHPRKSRPRRPHSVGCSSAGIHSDLQRQRQRRTFQVQDWCRRLHDRGTGPEIQGGYSTLYEMPDLFLSYKGAEEGTLQRRHSHEHIASLVSRKSAGGALPLVPTLCYTL